MVLAVALLVMQLLTLAAFHIEGEARAPRAPVGFHLNAFRRRTWRVADKRAASVRARARTVRAVAVVISTATTLYALAQVL